MTVTRPMLAISADFDSGNIQVIDASDPCHVRLAIRPDTHSDHFQWFHFKVANLVPGERHGFSLENAGQSSYHQAWHNYQAVASYDQKHWFRVPTQYDGATLRFDLTPGHPQVWFAYFEPYSRERHDWLVEQALSLGITGWVRNRADGSVEAMVAGSSEMIAAIVAKARQGSPASRVADVTVEEAPAQIFDGFEKRSTL